MSSDLLKMKKTNHITTAVDDLTLGCLIVIFSGFSVIGKGSVLLSLTVLVLGVAVLGVCLYLKNRVEVSKKIVICGRAVVVLWFIMVIITALYKMSIL